MEHNTHDQKQQVLASEHPSNQPYHHKSMREGSKPDLTLSPAASVHDEFDLEVVMRDLSPASSVLEPANSYSSSPFSDSDAKSDETALFDGLLDDPDSPAVPSDTSSVTGLLTNRLVRKPYPVCESTELGRTGQTSKCRPEDQVKYKAYLYRPIFNLQSPAYYPPTPRSDPVSPHTALSSPHPSPLQLPSPLQPMDQGLPRIYGSHARTVSEPPEEITFHRNGAYLGQPFHRRDTNSAALRLRRTAVAHRKRRQDSPHSSAETDSRQSRPAKRESPRSVPTQTPNQKRLIPRLAYLSSSAPSWTASGNKPPPGVWDAVLKMVEAGETLRDVIWPSRGNSDVERAHIKTRQSNHRIFSLDEPLDLVMLPESALTENGARHAKALTAHIPKTGRELREFDAVQTRRLLEIYNLPLVATFTFERKAMYLRFVGANEALMHAILD